MIAATDLIPRLKNVKKRDSHTWTARCPSHDDKKNSLSIAQAGEKMLLHCFAGCSFQQIIQASGLANDPLEKRPPPRQKPPEIPLKPLKLRFLGEMWANWAVSTPDAELDVLGVELGLSTEALRAVGCCKAWPHDGFGFPMYDCKGEFVGMRLRGENGAKWSIPGGREGMFMLCEFIPITEPFCIVEGATDLAALYSLGISGLGRPNCQGAIKDIVSFCRDRQIKPIIIADADEPGIKGCMELQKVLSGSKAWQLPAKDCRAFVNTGGTREEFMSGLRCVL